MIQLVCLNCMTLADPVCACTNAATISDPDGHLHIYVETIASTRLADVYYLNGEETYRELLDPFDILTYVDYKPLKNSHLNFQPYTPKNDYVPVKPNTHDKGLMKMLNRHNNTIASPGRIGSTRQRPSKKEHN